MSKTYHQKSKNRWSKGSKNYARLRNEIVEGSEASQGDGLKNRSHINPENKFSLNLVEDTEGHHSSNGKLKRGSVWSPINKCQTDCVEYIVGLGHGNSNHNGKTNRSKKASAYNLIFLIVILCVLITLVHNLIDPLTNENVTPTHPGLLRNKKKIISSTSTITLTSNADEASRSTHRNNTPQNQKDSISSVVPERSQTDETTRVDILEEKQVADNGESPSQESLMVLAESKEETTLEKSTLQETVIQNENIPTETEQSIDPQTNKNLGLDIYMNVWEERHHHDKKEIPVFWHIPRSGGSTVKEILELCHRLVLASEVLKGDESDQQSVGVVANIFEARNSFDVGYKGRLFTIVRDPIERAGSVYTYLKNNPEDNPAVAQMTLEQYAQSPHIENNWLTRHLSGQLEGELVMKNLQVAKDVLRRKFLVGLLDQDERSMERFEKYYGWKYIVDPPAQESCRAKLLGRSKESPPVEKGSHLYELLRWQNKFDLELYDYVKTLFVEQEKLVSDVSDGARLTPGQQPIAPQKKPSTSSSLLGKTYTPSTDLPPYVCEDRYPDGFPNEPLPNKFQLLSGATRPCYDNFADFPSEANPNDIPAFWHIPKAGGSTVKDIIGACLGLVQADEVGIRNGHADDKVLQIVEEDGSYFVNVDTTNTEGIKRSRDMGLAQSGLVDLITLINIQDADYLFDADHRGRFFTVFRDPVDRAISMYFYLSKAYWEPTYNPALQNMTLLEYASRGGPVENNFMVRFLVNQRRGAVGEEQLEFAKEVVKRKFLIGLLHKTEESFERFQKYFGLKANEGRDEAYAKDCMDSLLHGGSNKNTMVKKPKVTKDSEEYRLLLSQNDLDMKLYEFALELWEQQGEYFESQKSSL